LLHSDVAVDVSVNGEANLLHFSLQLTVELYEMLEAVNRKVQHLRFMDPISDFLYPFMESLICP